MFYFSQYGCCHVLCHLSENYSITVHPNAWSCATSMSPLSRDSSGAGANKGSSLHRTGSHRSIGSTGGTGRYVIVFVASNVLAVLHRCRHCLEILVVLGQTKAHLCTGPGVIAL